MALGWRKNYFRYKDYFLNVLNIYKTKTDLVMFLEIMLSLGAIIIFSLFALKPTLLTISQLLKDNKAKAETIEKMDQKIANLTQAQMNYDQISDKLSMIDSAIPQGPAPAEVIKQIEAIAAIHSVNLSGITTGNVVVVGTARPKRTPAGLISLPEGTEGVDFSISASGDYFSLLSFLKDLENLRRPIKIDSLTFNSSARNDQKVIVISISGRFPYVPNTLKI